MLGQGVQIAMCLSVVVIVESFVGQPGRTPSGQPKKEITGYFLSQEFKRFAGAAGAVFNTYQFWTHTANSAFKFGTYVKPDNSQYAAKAPASSDSGAMFAATPSPSSVASSSVRPVLNWDSHIPIYDYRSERTFDPRVHLYPASYAKALPSHRDLPVRSLALVAYTTTKFILSNGDPGLGCNLMWAALLAAPPKSGLPEPPSPIKKLAVDRALDTPTKGSSKKR
ncbi:hypothetical protein BJ138DRAFT_1107018 [Hygrophoropsis aurantiaca]|uniref:Uncharacterized protein n=1 Tax=Hygrophoropsis aurantiaca TaxID=72124 RepID=A0ACB7ZTP5_9AGAM|nr:hypothetical protein BJ138DRAFT_1107018 [Hygrophoropsis aurantiaca]